MIKWIKELRSTEKGKILFKLSLYLLFFFIVLVLCIVAGSMKSPYYNLQNSSSSENSRQEETKTLSYFDKQSLLVEGDYSFSYEINLADKKVSFLGKKEGNSIEGFKEDGNNLIHYLIEEGKTYKLELSQKKEITDLYEGIDTKCLNYRELFKTLNAMSATITRQNEEKTYTYTQENKTYNVYVGDKYIKKIEIAVDQDKYILEFIF